MPTPAKLPPELIFEFCYRGELLHHIRDTGEESARGRFAREFTEWADDLVSGKVKVKSRLPTY